MTNWISHVNCWHSPTILSSDLLPVNLSLYFRLYHNFSNVFRVVCTREKWRDDGRPCPFRYTIAKPIVTSIGDEESKLAGKWKDPRPWNLYGNDASTLGGRIYGELPVRVYRAPAYVSAYKTRPGARKKEPPRFHTKETKIFISASRGE